MKITIDSGLEAITSTVKNPRSRRITMNFKRLTISLAAIGLLLFAASAAYSDDEETAPIPGRQMMSEQERDQYRTAMQALKTEEERAAVRKSHQKEMQSRAREQGVELREGAGPRGRGKMGAAGNDGQRTRGRGLMTAEEKKQQREKMRSATSDEERKRLRDENHEKMKARAHERGEQLSDEPNPRGGPGKGHGEGRGQRQGEGQGMGRDGRP
jgi:hypothetical protein